MNHRRERVGEGRHEIRWLGLAVIVVALLASGAAPPTPARGDPSARRQTRDEASEYWDLVARLDSGHQIFERFLITNMGPGKRTAVAFGHLVFPDGRTVEFKNGRREGRWKLSDDGLHLKIGSSILDQRGPRHRFEYDSDKRGIKIHLSFETNDTPQWSASPEPPGYWMDLLDMSAPVEGSIWVKGMDAPLAVGGRVAITHTWMNRSEPDLTLRRIEFFSLQAGSGLYFADLTTPAGDRTRWLVVQGPDGVVHRFSDFELVFDQAAPPRAPAGWKEADYPVPGILRIRGANLEGEVRLRRVIAHDDPLEVIPQPFRFLLSFAMRPRRMWTDSPFEVRIVTDSGPVEIRGSGVTSVTFLNPLRTSSTNFPPRNPGV